MYHTDAQYIMLGTIGISQLSTCSSMLLTGRSKGFAMQCLIHHDVSHTLRENSPILFDISEFYPISSSLRCLSSQDSVGLTALHSLCMNKASGFSRFYASALHSQQIDYNILRVLGLNEAAVGLKLNVNQHGRQ